MIETIIWQLEKREYKKKSRFKIFLKILLVFGVNWNKYLKMVFKIFWILIMENAIYLR